MIRFPKILSYLLIQAILLTSFGQVKSASGVVGSSRDSQTSEIPSYSEYSIQGIWGIVNPDINTQLIESYSNSESEEDNDEHHNQSIFLESSNSSYTSILLSSAKKILVSPSARDLIYPFHFFF